MIRVKTAPLTISLAFGCGGSLVALLHSVEGIGTRLGFLLMTLLLVGYLSAQVAYLRRVHPDRWLINPILLCSATIFLLGFGSGSMLFFLSPETLDLLGFIPDITPAMFKMIGLVLLAAIGMWQGYWSGVARHYARPAAQARFAGVLRKSNQLRPFIVPLLLAVSVAARLMQIRLGIFGYSGSHENFVAAGGYSQYLALLSSVGKLALVAATIHYQMVKGKDRGQLFVVLIVELVFGFLSGFKSQIILPFVIVGFCQYLATGKLPRRWVVGVVVGIFVAYQIVEPFRVIRNEQVSYRGTSVAEIAAAIVGARASEIRQSAEGSQQVAVLLSFLARSSSVYVGSLGIDYLDHTPVLPEGSPRFLENILMAPAYAWIPRAIWADKPLGDLGLWYTQEVLGNQQSLSATAMTPVTFLYFTGGPLAIFAGFFFIGMVQRVVFSWCQPARYVGGALVFLGILPAIAMPNDGLNDLIIILLREVPLLLLVQNILLRPLRRRSPQWDATRPLPMSASKRG